MKTFSEFQEDIQEKAGIAKTIFKMGKRLYSGGKKFLGKKTIPGTKINLPIGMSRGEAGLIQIGASGTLGKAIIDRKKNRKELDNIMKFNYQEEIAVAPTNSTGPAVPGTGDDSSTVVVREKKPPMLKRKTYAKGGVKSRKPWLDYLKNK